MLHDAIRLPLAICFMGKRVYVSVTLSWGDGCTFLGRCHRGTVVRFWDVVMGERVYVSGRCHGGTVVRFWDVVMGNGCTFLGRCHGGTVVRFWDAVMGERLYVSGMFMLHGYFLFTVFLQSSVKYQGNYIFLLQELINESVLRL